MGQATGRPRGRPKGAKNKLTEQREREMADAAAVIEDVIGTAFTGDAHALLMAVYKDPNRDIHLRVDAAKAAVRYEKPALSTVEQNSKVTIQNVVALPETAESVDEWKASISTRQ